MKKLAFSWIFTFCCCFFLSAQVPNIRWQKSIGSSDYDYLRTIASRENRKIYLKANNGNIIVAGIKGRSDGDFSGMAKNVFIGEIDSARNWVWKKDFGGDGFDEISAVQPGIDGGFIIIGSSTSGNNTADSDVPANYGSRDVWVFKISSTGQMIWKKNYGGSDDDYGAHIEKVGNSGYVFIGGTHSTDLDLQNVRNRPDSTGRGSIWVMRIDLNGNQMWSKCFGGTNGLYDQFYAADEGYIIKPTPDGGMICGANMFSTNYDGIGNHGDADIWLAKLNSAGGLEWSKCYGGSGTDFLGDIEVSGEGGYVFAAQAYSKDGDVTGAHDIEPYYSDAWVVKINPLGQIEWQKSIGGTSKDEFNDIVIAQDNTIVAIGSTYSKDGDVLKNSGESDYWICKISKAGTLIWSKTFGGTQDDFGLNIFATAEQEFLLYGESLSNNLEVSGSHGYLDLWLVQLGNSSRIKGTVFYDTNLNGIKDMEENWADNVMVTSSKMDYERSALTHNGAFWIDVDTGSYTITVQSNSEFYNPQPASFSIDFHHYFLQDSVSFALQPIPNKKDLSVNVIPLSATRPGFQSNYLIQFNNKGTEPIESGTVVFVKDRRLLFENAEPDPDNQSGDTFTWNYTNLKPGDTASLFINLRILPPPQVKNGDSLVSTAFIYPTEDDIDLDDNKHRLLQIVTGSFDPNDKAEAHGGFIIPEQVNNAEYLYYTIRFQNMGTDTAFNIVVRDTLDAGLNWSSLEMIASSHPYNLVVKERNKLAWEVPNILLPDDKTNEPLSHGYISYRIRPKKFLVLGDKIHNSASIYFDYNLPVVTNDAVTEVKEPSNPLPLTLLFFRGRCEEHQKVLQWATANETGFSHFVIESGGDGKMFSAVGTVAANGIHNKEMRYQFQISDATNSGRASYFRLRMVDTDGKIKYSPVLFVGCTNQANSNVRIYPNPAMGGQTTLDINAVSNGIAQLTIYDATGRKPNTDKLYLQKGNNLILLHQLSKMLSGNYWITVKHDGKEWTSQISILQ